MKYVINHIVRDIKQKINFYIYRQLCIKYDCAALSELYMYILAIKELVQKVAAACSLGLFCISNRYREKLSLVLNQRFQIIDLLV